MFLSILKAHKKLIIGCIIVSIALLFFGSRASQSYRHAVESDSKVIATVSKVEDLNDPDSTELYEIYVNYTYEGVLFNDIYMYDSVKKLDIGYQVEVYVDPDNPADIVNENSSVGTVMGLMIPPILLTYLGCLYLGQKKIERAQ